MPAKNRPGPQYMKQVLAAKGQKNSHVLLTTLAAGSSEAKTSFAPIPRRLLMSECQHGHPSKLAPVAQLVFSPWQLTTRCAYTGFQYALWQSLNPIIENRIARRCRSSGGIRYRRPSRQWPPGWPRNALASCEGDVLTTSTCCQRHHRAISPNDIQRHRFGRDHPRLGAQRATIALDGRSQPKTTPNTFNQETRNSEPRSAIPGRAAGWRADYGPDRICNRRSVRVLIEDTRAA